MISDAGTARARHVGGYIWRVRVLRIALRVSLGLVALGFLGAAAGIATLTVMCPAGCPQQSSPPVPLLVAAGAFVVGGIGAVASSTAIASRQSANPPQPQPPLEGTTGAGDPARSAGSGPVVKFRPMGIGLRQGATPSSSSIPWGQRLTIRPDGLEMRNLFDRAWVARDRITGLYRMPGAIQVMWDDGYCTATVIDLFRIKKIIGAMEEAGYRFAGARS